MAVWEDIVCGGEDMRYGHLERVELHLRALSPVFIGSGEELSKKEYIYNKADGKIYMPDLAKLTAFLSKRSLIPAFQSFLLHPKGNDLYFLLCENGIEKKDYSDFVSYVIDAGEVASSEHFRGVLTFIKGPDGRPYIPGSSLKGVIRTAIAAKLLEKGNFEKSILEIEKAADDFRNPRRYISKEAKYLESQLFCKLSIKDPRNPNMNWHHIVNDFMKGISISDSAPIAFENLTLCGKYDRKPDGFTKQLPIYRECLVPGTNTRFVLTMDRLVLDRVGIDKRYIEEALYYFSNMQYESFEQHFAEMQEDSEQKAINGVDIILGGGAGYVSKTLSYPLIYNRQRALKLVSKMMIKQFRAHKHEKDLGMYNVSPHTFKTTRYNGTYYQMGRCELVFE